MAAINDLIAQVADPELRRRLTEEVRRVMNQKKFGLVFEDHMPEAIPLPEVPIKKGSHVARRSGDTAQQMLVADVNDEGALCMGKGMEEPERIPLEELVCVAVFGEPVYPYLELKDTVSTAPDVELWHALIQADNYHALQLLAYLYPGQVDCIYIDPPYNTGARDWKYNNDYVDTSDQYRHSKWLSMMKRRLHLAKQLLNPKDSVLIVTIDEKEYLHLGCLLEEMFPEARMQMVSSVINSGGVARENQFSRSDEYLFFVQIGSCSPTPLPLDDEWFIKADQQFKSLYWRSLSRAGSNDSRRHSPGCFYPIYVYSDGSKIHSVGEALPVDMDRNEIIAPEGTVAIWPLHMDGSEGCWMQTPKNLKALIAKGYVRLGKFTERGMAIKYLNKKEIEKVESGLYDILGNREDGSIITEEIDTVRNVLPTTQWRISSHNARSGGTEVLKKIFGLKPFPFPKSVYAVHDALMFYVINKPRALIIDFFAGSGTTLHAVNLLNAEDGGQRRCILVTNNEVNEKESKALVKQGYQPGDEVWERLGIAQHDTWPRTVCSIKGEDVNGHPLKGNYLSSDRPMSDGFKANCAFFQLGFLDKTSVALGRQFRELLPLLWMKTGACGQCPQIGATDDVPPMLVLANNHFAVLTDENRFAEFAEALRQSKGIKTAFLITNSESNFLEMAAMLPAQECIQLYRDYLDNFRINRAR